MEMHQNSRYYEYLYARDSQQTPIAQFSTKQIATPRTEFLLVFLDVFQSCELPAMVCLLIHSRIYAGQFRRRVPFGSQLARNAITC